MLTLAAIAILAQSVAVPPNLILPNYDRLPIGQREGIEAGAFLARTNDAGANWYNPAGLGKSQKTALNASATAYDWTSMSLEGFGTSEGRSRINTIGTLLSVAIGEGTIKSDRWRLGFSITNPIVWRPSSIDFAFSPSANEVFSYASVVDFNTMIPGLAVAYTPGGVKAGRFRVGAGLGMAITSLSQTQNVSIRVNTGASASVTERDFSAEGSTWQIQPSGGFQWDASPRIIIGARLVAPGLRILGSSRMTLETSQFQSDTSTDLVFRDDGATFDYKRPFEGAGGVAYHASAFEFELDVHYYGAINSYSMYESELPGTLTTVDSTGTPAVSSPAFVPTANSARAVTNVSAGGNYRLTNSLRVHAGFASDFSPVDDQSQSVFRKVDLTRLTTGLSLTGQKLSGSLGFGYSFGSGKRTTLGNSGGGQPIETRFNVSTFNLLFALSYGF